MEEGVEQRTGGGTSRRSGPFSRVLRAFDFFRHTPCATLLAVQLLGVLIYPTLEDQTGRAGGLGRSVLGLPLIALTIAEGFQPDNDTITLWSGLVHAVFYFYTAYALVRYMFNDDDVTTDELADTLLLHKKICLEFARGGDGVDVFTGPAPEPPQQ